MNEALLPCPFCGAECHFEIDDEQWQWVECGRCKMQSNRSVSLMEDCKPTLTAAWNCCAALAPADSVLAPAGEVVAGIEAAAKLLERKADDFARENGSDDLGSLSFGRGAHADAKLEYHSTLLELAEEIRSLAPPPPAQAADSVLEDAARYRHIRDVPHSEEVRSVLSLQQNAVMDKVIDKDRAAVLERLIAARKQGANHD